MRDDAGAADGDDPVVEREDSRQADQPRSFTDLAGSIAHSDRQPARRKQEHWPNPMGGFLLLLYPWRRYVLLITVALAVALIAWSLLAG